MTLEQMQAAQQRVAEVLSRGGLDDVEALEFEPGRSPVIAFRIDDDDLFLELTLA